MPTAERHVMPSHREYIRLGGRRVEYRLVESKAARSLRVRVGPAGIEVLCPANRSNDDVLEFLDLHADWVLGQIHRVEPLRNLWRAEKQPDQLLFRGVPTRVRITTHETRAQGASIKYEDGEILVRRGVNSQTPVARSLENWLRRQARATILAELAAITPRLGVTPNRVYVMGQRTKWGNCSARRNLSFNWRLILAPESVLRYLITHEAVHLAIPDHSAKFWLTVQSLCPQTERAKQWLSVRADDIRIVPIPTLA